MAVRPTSDRVREAVFGILGGRVAGSKVLDLFAGTGAMAIEALSRGAAEAVLVESSPVAADVMRSNLASFGDVPAACLVMDFRKALRSPALRRRKYSLAFLDPPYGKGLVGAAADALETAGVLEPGAVVVAEAAARDPGDAVPENWVRETERRYGDTRVTLYEVRIGPEEPPGPPGEETR